MSPAPPARDRAPGPPSALGVAGELLAWLRGARRWFRVRGDSMTPTLEAGDCVLVDTRRAGPGALPPIGQLVVVRDPADRAHVLVKRVGSLGRRTFAVRSDNALEGRDSRHFGSLDPGALVGPATLVFTRRGHLRWPETTALAPRPAREVGAPAGAAVEGARP